MHGPPSVPVLTLNPFPSKAFEDEDDFLVVDDVVVGESAGFAVFHPFLRGLVAADEKFPGNLRDIVEILSRIDEDSSGRFHKGRAHLLGGVSFSPGGTPTLQATFSTTLLPEVG